MENTIKLTRDEIIDEVKRTKILRAHYLSENTIKLIYSINEDYWEGPLDDFLKEKHLIAFLKLVFEDSKKYSKDDLEIINLVYEPPIETLMINNGYVELFADRSMLYHWGTKSLDIFTRVVLYFSVNDYVSRNIELFIAAHDKQYLEPKTLTETDRDEIILASFSHFKFHYESDLRTIYSIAESPHQERNFLRTITLKRPKLTSLKIVHAAIGKLDMTYLSESGAKIVEDAADKNQYTDPNKFLQIQSTLHLLERKFLRALKEPELAGQIEHLKMDLLRIQAFKEASADIDQIIFPKAETLVFSDRSVLFAPEGEEPECHLDVYQFIMDRLRYLQSVYFSHDRSKWGWKSDSDAVSSQFNKYGISFSFAGGRVVTTFTRKFINRLFNAANVQICPHQNSHQKIKAKETIEKRI